MSASQHAPAAQSGADDEDRWAYAVEHCPVGALALIASAFDPDALWRNMARQCGFGPAEALHIRAYIGRNFRPNGSRR